MKNKLAIKTPDNRLLFTNISNLADILEYAKTIGLELSIAKAKPALDLENLVEALCSPILDFSEEPHEIVKGIYPAKPRNRKRSQLENLRVFITNKLLETNSVTIGDIKGAFPTSVPSAISFCMAQVVKELSSTGITVKRVQRGVYEIK